MTVTASPEPYRLAAGVILVPTDDGSARLLNMDGAFYALSDIGAEMLRGVLDSGVPETVRDLARNYGVEPERVCADLRELLGKLRKARLVRTGAVPSRAQRLRTAAIGFAVARILRLVIASPSSDDGRVVALLVFARLCFALLGWAQTVLLWSRARPRSATGCDNPNSAQLIERIDTTVRRCAARLPAIACKERALCAWYLLCRQDIPSTLVVGIRLFPLEGHCWCAVGSRTLTDFPDRCETYTPIICYGPGLSHEPTTLSSRPTTDPVYGGA